MKAVGLFVCFLNDNLKNIKTDSASVIWKNQAMPLKEKHHTNSQPNNLNIWAFIKLLLSTREYTSTSHELINLKLSEISTFFVGLVLFWLILFCFSETVF